jgi:hypothetical protein
VGVPVFPVAPVTNIDGFCIFRLLPML